MRELVRCSRQVWGWLGQVFCVFNKRYRWHLCPSRKVFPDRWLVTCSMKRDRYFQRGAS